MAEAEPTRQLPLLMELRGPFVGPLTMAKVRGQSPSGSLAVRVMPTGVSSSVLTAKAAATGGLLVTLTLTAIES